MPTAKTLFCVTGTVREIGNIELYRHAFNGNQAIRMVASELEKQYPSLRIFIENAKARPAEPRNKIKEVRMSPLPSNPPPRQISLI